LGTRNKNILGFRRDDETRYLSDATVERGQKRRSAAILKQKAFPEKNEFKPVWVSGTMEPNHARPMMPRTTARVISQMALTTLRNPTMAIGT
jgi:hypothetical protein